MRYGWFVLAVAVAATSSAADWPMQRHDSARSGMSPDPLPVPLALRWVWRLPKRNAVFGPDRRSRIDGSYDATVAGRTLYLGCEYNDSVVAMDTDTGREKWRFYAEGAVRFAPSVAGERLFFGADDGRLYCLDAASGTLLWRFDGAPTSRKIINHERIASNWLVTGGPVVHDGVVCFSCGAWPLDGVCAYGVDAETGRERWRHDTWSTISNGYLSVRGGLLSLRVGERGRERLGAATGRLVPAQKEDTPLLHWRKARDLWQAADRTRLPGGVVFPEGWDPYYAIASAGRQVFGAGMLWRPDQPNTAYGVVGIEETEGDAKPRVFFARKFDSRILDTVCADDKLFVMTQNGGLYCFGAAAGKEPVELTLPAPRAAKAADGAAGAVGDILARTGRREGFCLVWGLADGRVVEELLYQSQLQVCAVDPDAAKVNAIRRRLDAAGLYRARLQLYVGEPVSFGFPPYAADLIVSEDVLSGGFARGEAFVEAVFHSLRPYGGTACFEPNSAGRASFASWVQKVNPPRGKLAQAGGWTMLVREGALPFAADWMHEMRDAANSLCSPDELARPPFSVLWFGGPAGEYGVTYQEMLPPGPVVVDGRYLMQGPNKLAAIDIYTGRRFWEVALPKSQHNATRYGDEPPPYPDPAPGEIPVAEVSRGTGLNLVAASDVIYVAAASECLLLSTASGETLRTFPMPIADPAASKLCWGRLFLADDLLIATAFDPAVVKRGFPGWRNNNEKNKDRLPMRYLLAVDRHTGKLAWQRKAANAFNGRAVAIGNGRVLCTDTLTPEMFDTLKAAGGNPQPSPPAVMALDVRSGRQLWTRPLDIVATKIACTVARDMLLLPSRVPLTWEKDRWVSTAPPGANPKDKSKAPGAMVALRGSDGQELWRVGEFQYGEPPMICGDLLLTRHGLPFRLEDGRPHLRRSPATGEAETWQCPKGGCNFLVGSRHVVTSRTRYYDVRHHSGQCVLVGMRSGCTPSIIPAGGVMGLLNYSSHSSDPYRSAVVFVHNPDTVNWMRYAPGRGEAAPDRPLRRVALNLAAPGDHAGPDGAVWFRQGLGDRKKKRTGNAAGIDVTIDPATVQAFGAHPLRLRRADDGALPFVAASGFEGVETVRIALCSKPGERLPYAVRLHFAEPGGARLGERLFSVSLQGREVIAGLDAARAAGGPLRAIVREFHNVATDREIRIDLRAIVPGRPPLLCGVEIRLEEPVP